jgi:HEAT repeat protein
MKSHRPTLRICLQIIFLSLLTVSSVQASEPSYNGRPLSEWLLVLEEGHTMSGEPVEAPTAEEAIRQIGTNGIPTLIDLLGVYDKWSANKVLSKLHNKDLTAWFKYEENIFSSCENIRKLGLRGFSILGTNAECAVPQITKMLAYSDEAPRALLAVGPKGFSALTNAMNDPNLSVRDGLIRALGKGGGGDPEVIKQLLVNALKDPDTLVRLHAAELLEGKEPDLTIPALVPLLSDNAYRWRAANLLAAYGPAAKSAAPNIFSIFTNQPDMMLLPALRKIDPDIAAQAETFLINSGPLNPARSGYTKTPLPNGKVLIAGGYIHTEIPKIVNRILSSAELLDPVTGKWTETHEMNTARCDHIAILLQSGKVLVAGGSDDKGHGLASAELYDPVTGKWTETGSMNNAHVNDSPVLQHDGKVWIKGDWNGRQFNGDELYDPATGKWTVITNK